MMSIFCRKGIFSYKCIYNGQYLLLVLLWRVVARDHSGHEIWTLYMWLTSMDQCSPASSVWHKFSDDHKSTHFSYKSGRVTNLRVTPIPRTLCECSGILSSTPELAGLPPWTPPHCDMAGCWKINSILTNIGLRNSIEILNQYCF